MPISGPSSLEEQRNRLIEFLRTARPQGSLKNKVTVVFDGQPGVVGRPEFSVSGPEILFSKGPSADEMIHQIVAQSSNSKNMVVVTNDRRIQYAVRALGAKVNGVQEFLDKAKGIKSRVSRPASETSRPRKESKTISYTSAHKITEELKKIWIKDNQPQG